MRIKRIKKIRVCSNVFSVVWDKKDGGGSYNYQKQEIRIGVKSGDTNRIFEILCHELFEVCAVECYVRYSRMDVEGDFVFCFDHKQHSTIQGMFAGLLSQFID